MNSGGFFEMVAYSRVRRLWAAFVAMVEALFGDRSSPGRRCRGWRRDEAGCEHQKVDIRREDYLSDGNKRRASRHSHAARCQLLHEPQASLHSDLNDTGSLVNRAHYSGEFELIRRPFNRVETVRQDVGNKV